MTSPASSTDSDPRFTAGLKYLVNQGRLKQWAGMMAGENLQFQAEQQQKNQQAEDAYVRTKLWGSTEANGKAEDDMRQTILGDVSETHHNYPPPAPKSLLGKAALALALASPLVAGAVMAPAIIEALKPAAPVVVPNDPPEFTDTDTDTRFELHLGRPE